MIYSYKDSTPEIAKSAFVAESADLIGDVRVGENSSIWFNATLRADLSPIMIGENCSVQDNCAIHVDAGLPTVIGNHVTLGHGAIVHAATIEDNCLIGMGAVVLDEAHIGHGSIIAAGAVVPPRMVVPPYSQVMGVPGKVVKTLEEEKEQGLIKHAQLYVELKDTYQ